MIVTVWQMAWRYVCPLLTIVLSLSLFQFRGRRRYEMAFQNLSSGMQCLRICPVRLLIEESNTVQFSNSRLDKGPLKSFFLDIINSSSFKNCELIDPSTVADKVERT